jgi:hypothetical protein
MFMIPVAWDGLTMGSSVAAKAHFFIVQTINMS